MLSLLKKRRRSPTKHWQNSNASPSAKQKKIVQLYHLVQSQEQEQLVTILDRSAISNDEPWHREHKSHIVDAYSRCTMKVLQYKYFYQQYKYRMFPSFY